MSAQALDMLDHLRTAAIRVVTAPSIPVVGESARFGAAFRGIGHKKMPGGPFEPPGS
jgi:hypothetical protein